MRKEIEIKAIKEVTNYYENLGYTINSVEADNVGCDLEARINKTILRVEVKGTSSENISIELTPNEFNKMQEYRDSYRLAVVTNTLEEANLHIFSFSNEMNEWIDDKKNILEIKEIISARCVV